MSMSDIERRVLILETQLQRTQKVLGQLQTLAQRLAAASQAGGGSGGAGVLMLFAQSGGTAGTGRSGGTAGSVTVTAVDSSLSPVGSSFTAYSLSATGVAASVYLILFSADNGVTWWVDYEEC